MKPKIRKVCLFVTAGMLFGIGGGWWWLDASGVAAVEAAKERCRAAGLPMSFKNIRQPPVPDDDKAEALLNKMNSLGLFDTENNLESFFVLRSMESEGMPGHTSDSVKFWKIWFYRFQELHPYYILNEVTASELDAHLKSSQIIAFTDLIYAATAKMRADDPGPGLGVDDPLCLSFYCIQILEWKARLAASRGQRDEANQAIWTMVRLAEFYGSQSRCLSWREEASVWREVITALERLASAGCLTPEWSKKFSGEFTLQVLDRSFLLDIDIAWLAGAEHFENILSGKVNVSDYLASSPDPRLSSYE